MNAKKTKEASLEGRSVFYFLIGLNLVLLGVWMLFGMQTINSDFVEVVEVRKEKEAEVIPVYEIEEKIPEYKEPEPEIEKIPEPELIDIEEVKEPLEEPVELKEPERIPFDVPIGKTTKPKQDFDLTALKEKAEALKEETTLAPMSPTRVDQMAIYPGCEKYEGQKRALMKCFSEKLSADMIKYLDTEYPDVDKDMVQVQLEFLVDTKGEIVDVNPVRGDNEFKPQAKEALEKVAQRLKRKNKKITPAKMNTGEEVLLQFKNTVKLKRP